MNNNFNLKQFLAEGTLLNEDQSFFNNFKNFVDNYFKNSDQNIDVSNTNSFDELMKMVDDYWDQDQTKDMLEAFINDYFDNDQILGMYINFIEQNL
jgi:DNA-binding transcriptional regulator PaaX